MEKPMFNQLFRPTCNRVGFVLFVLFSQHLVAEDALELEDMIVTAGLQPISISDVASSITVITREEIEQKQVRTLADLLRDVPGFAVSQAGGTGSQAQIRVRGAEANQLLVLIDGVRANDPALSDEFQYQYALTANIERIEIIRGPQSATWGSDAMAGVINIIRSKSETGKQVSGNVEGGSFGTQNLAVDGGYSGKLFRLHGGLSYLDTNGTNIARTGSEGDGTKNTTGSMVLEFDTSEAINFRFSGQLVDASNEFDDIDFLVTGLPTDTDRITESQQVFLAGKISYEPTQSPWSGNLSVQKMDSDNDNFSDGIWTNSTAAESLELRLRGGVTFGATEALGHRISFALEHEKVDFSQRGEVSFFGNPNQDQSYDVNGFALEYVGRPVTGFTWTASGRLDDYSDFDDATTWQVAAAYEFSTGLRLHGSVGTGSKAPTFTERYGFFEDFFIGNPELKPEYSQGWEIGLDTNWVNGQYKFQLAYFDQDLQDEIDGFVFDPVTFLFTGKNKESDSNRRGIEAVFDARLGQSITLGASYTFTDATEVDSMNQVVREIRRPRHMANLTANYRFANDRGNLNLKLNYNGPQLDVFFSPTTFIQERVKIKAYTILNLAAAWRLTKALELTGRVSNLLDEEYEEILGFVRPGIAAFAGLRGRF